MEIASSERSGCAYEICEIEQEKLLHRFFFHPARGGYTLGTLSFSFLFKSHTSFFNLLSACRCGSAYLQRKTVYDTKSLITSSWALLHSTVGQFFTLEIPKAHLSEEMLHLRRSLPSIVFVSIMRFSLHVAVSAAVPLAEHIHTLKLSQRSSDVKSTIQPGLCCCGCCLLLFRCLLVATGY